MSEKRQAIKDELKSRLMAERSLLAFCKYVDPKHPTEARHVQVLTQALEQVAEYILSGGQRGINRLMVFMPPRYWKSQTVSRKFPAWLLGKNPDLRIILTSYGADLATKHSKAVRDLIMTDAYSSVFGQLSSTDEPIELDPESMASAAWEIADHNGGMQARSPERDDPGGCIRVVQVHGIYPAGRSWRDHRHYDEVGYRGSIR